MTKRMLIMIMTLFMTMIAHGAKTVYIPTTWSYNQSTQEYTEGGNSDLQWSYKRSKQSDNCIIFWQKGFGTDPSTAPSLNGTDMTFDVDAVLAVAEQCYAMNVNTLGFTNSNMKDNYKLLILMNYTDTWTCYGGGYDFACSALWLNPATVKPAGHSLAHEVGHSFHYMCYAEASGYSPTSSSTINTGFHLSCGNGQAIWEQTAQWQANQSFPAEMFNQSYPLFGNNANYAFSHEWMRYQSYWFHYYLCEHYSDLTTVAQVWKQPMTGQSNGNATDFCQALMAKKSLSASQFYALYFDYALKCATYDFTAAASYRDDYIGKFDYYAVQLDTKKYQVAYASAPQSTGFNVIELTVPSSGTTITTKFTALQHGCALADADPGQYNNGTANALVSAGVKNYNSAGTASYRGFCIGYVFLKSDGTREYYNDNTVHCTGTAEVTENISTTVPANTSRIFLVVTPALTTYVKHAWDENISNDDQWPYSFELVGTDLKTAKLVEKVPDEPTFSKVIDGRAIKNVTLTYHVTLEPTSGYDGTTVTFNNNGLNALCTAFQLEGDDIFNKIVAYSASGPGNGEIMNYAANADGSLQSVGRTTNPDFGHWFQADGTATTYGNSTVVFAEFTKSTKSGTIGQFPNLNSSGDTRTIREALRYKDNNGNTATAYLVFNITFKANASPLAYLESIDYGGETPVVYNVGSPNVSVADGSYIQSLNTVTFDYANASSSDGTSFSILNNGAKVTLTKSGTTVAEGTLSLNNTVLTAAFNSLTLDAGATYTLSLPAGVVGYNASAANTASSLTLHTPAVFDGTYYLYNTDTQQYLSRAGTWATQAVLDDWGLAIILNTDAQGKTTLKYFDNQRYLYKDDFCYADGETGLSFTVSQVTSGYKFLNQSNNKYLAVYGGNAVGDAEEGVNLVGTSNVWNLESTAAHVANYTRCADVQAATAATAASVSGVTSFAAMESLMASSSYEALDIAITGGKAERYQWYAARAEANTPSEYIKETVTDLTPGLYRLSVDAFQRAAWFEDVDAADGARGSIYVYAGNAKTQLKSVMDYGSTTAFADTDYQSGGYYYANREQSGYDALSTGNYNNVVYVYVPADDGKTTGTLTFGINNPNRLGNDLSRGTWAVFQNFKLQRMVPVVTIAETDATAPAAINHAIVQLTRTLKGGQWNGFSAPFGFTVAGSPLDGAEVKEFDSANDNVISFKDATEIVAGEPYIVKPASDIVNPRFYDVNITNPDEAIHGTGAYKFAAHLYYTTLPFDGSVAYISTTDSSVKKLTSGGIKGLRSYFQIPTGSNVKALVLKFDDETTGIGLTPDPSPEREGSADVWYDLQGRKIRDERLEIRDKLPRGVYIHNGKKIVK